MASQAPPQPSTSARSAGSFGTLELASLRGEISTDGVSFPKVSPVAGLFKDVFTAKKEELNE